MSRDFSWFYLLIILIIGLLFQNCAPARSVEGLQSTPSNTWQAAVIEGTYTQQLDGCGPVVCPSAGSDAGWESCYKLQEITTTPTEGQRVRVEGEAMKPEGSSQTSDSCMSNMHLMRVKSWQSY
jgi:hypothetical protein